MARCANWRYFIFQPGVGRHSIGTMAGTRLGMPDIGRKLRLLVSRNHLV